MAVSIHCDCVLGHRRNNRGWRYFLYSTAGVEGRLFICSCSRHVFLVGVCGPSERLSAGPSESIDAHRPGYCSFNHRSVQPLQYRFEQFDGLRRSSVGLCDDYSSECEQRCRCEQLPCQQISAQSTHRDSCRHVGSRQLHFHNHVMQFHVFVWPRLLLADGFGCVSSVSLDLRQRISSDCNILRFATLRRRIYIILQWKFNNSNGPSIQLDNI